MKSSHQLTLFLKIATSNKNCNIICHSSDFLTVGILYFKMYNVSIFNSKLWIYIKAAILYITIVISVYDNNDNFL